MNFAHPPAAASAPTTGLGPTDSRDSGMSSQDCSELTPTVERTPVFPRLSNKKQMNKLVRKLSEVEGIDYSGILRSMKTSVDEGVELDYSDSALSDTSGPMNYPACLTTSSSQSGSSGIVEEANYFGSSASSSNCESIDSGNLDPAWTQSLPSCTDQQQQPSDPEPVQVHNLKNTFHVF